MQNLYSRNYIVHNFRACFRGAQNNRERLNILIFPLNGARDIISLTNYCQIIRKLAHKEVQIEKINEDNKAAI